MLFLFTCVAASCVSSDDCSDPLLSKCEPSTATCVACCKNDDCGHFSRPTLGFTSTCASGCQGCNTCENDVHCTSVAESFCAGSPKQCRPCEEDAHCARFPGGLRCNAGICSVSGECQMDADCHDINKSHCLVGAGSNGENICSICSSSAHCAHHTDYPVCVSGNCARCGTNNDCMDPSHAKCDDGCVPCSRNLECSGRFGNRNICHQGDCMECRTNVDCMDPARGKCSDYVCLACSSPEDCAHFGHFTCLSGLCQVRAECSSHEECWAIGDRSKTRCEMRSGRCVACETNQDCERFAQHRGVPYSRCRQRVCSTRDECGADIDCQDPMKSNCALGRGGDGQNICTSCVTDNDCKQFDQHKCVVAKTLSDTDAYQYKRTGGVKSCVRLECIADNDCPMENPVCDLTRNKCTTCLTDHECVRFAGTEGFKYYYCATESPPAGCKSCGPKIVAARGLDAPQNGAACERTSFNTCPEDMTCKNVAGRLCRSQSQSFHGCTCSPGEGKPLVGEGEKCDADTYDQCAGALKCATETLECSPPSESYEGCICRVFETKIPKEDETETGEGIDVEGLNGTDAEGINGTDAEGINGTEAEGINGTDTNGTATNGTSTEDNSVSGLDAVSVVLIVIACLVFLGIVACIIFCCCFRQDDDDSDDDESSATKIFKPSKKVQEMTDNWAPPKPNITNKNPLLAPTSILHTPKDSRGSNLALSPGTKDRSPRIQKNSARFEPELEEARSSRSPAEKYVERENNSWPSKTQAQSSRPSREGNSPREERSSRSPREERSSRSPREERSSWSPREERPPRSEGEKARSPRSPVNPERPPRPAGEKARPPRSPVNTERPPRSEGEKARPPRSPVNTERSPRSAGEKARSPQYPVNTERSPRSPDDQRNLTQNRYIAAATKDNKYERRLFEGRE